MKTAVIALTKNGCKTAMLLHRELEKESEVSVVSTKVSGTKKKPRKLKKKPFLGGMLKLSRENGYAKATAYFDGKRDVINTKEHPLIDEVRYENEDSLLDKIKSRILSLSKRHE